MYNKTKDPFVALSGKLYSTGRKSPAYEFSIRAVQFKFECSITKKKYSFSEYLKWWQSPEIQKYVHEGWEAYLEAKTQEPFKQPKYGDNVELVFSFRLKKRYNPRSQNIDGMKPIGETIKQPIQQMKPQHQASPAHELDDDLPDF